MDIFSRTMLPAGLILLTLPFLCIAVAGNLSMSAGESHDSVTGLSAISINAFYEPLDRSLSELHERVHSFPDVHGNSLFELLSNEHKSYQHMASRNSMPEISGIALFSDDGTWLSWSGPVTDIPSDWMMYVANSDPGTSSFLLYETPGIVHLVYISTSAHRMVMSQMVLVNRMAGTQQPDGLTDSLCPPGFRCQYKSPFQDLPGVHLFPDGLIESALEDLIVFTPPADHTPSPVGLSWLMRRFGILFNPRFFAAEQFGLRTAGAFLIFGMVLWIITHFLVPVKSGLFQTVVMAVAFSGWLVITYFVTTHVAESLIANTRSGWWPDFSGEHGLPTLVLPFSGLLITGALIRIALWLGLSAVNGAGKRRFHCRIPGWLCQAAAVLWLSPHFIHNAGIVTRSNLSGRVIDWVHQQETVYPLALETNLDILGKDAVLSGFLSTISPGLFPAFHLWRRSDLHALDTNFSVQILDVDGIVLDQFSPNFHPDTLHPETLNQILSHPSGRLVLSSQAHQSNPDSPLTGISTLYQNGVFAGFLVLQIFSDVQSVKPPAGHWGHNVMLFTASGGENHEWPHDSPVPLQPDWFETSGNEPYWRPDPTGRFDVLVYRLPFADAVRPEIVLAVLPVMSIGTHLSGFAKLSLLAMTLLIPGLVYRDFYRMIRTRFGLTYRSFTRQLLGAFLLPVILLPVFFTVTIHRIITDTESAFQRIQMTQILQQHQTLILERITDKALLLQADIEQQLLHHGEVDLPTDYPWLVLDSFGRIRLSHGVPDDYELPLSTITRVFQDNFFRSRSVKETLFVSSIPGNLSVQAVLPFPRSDHGGDILFPGTFLCEIPVTGRFLQSISNPADAILDLYALGSITASNRPELFNTGILSNRMDSEKYRDMVFSGVESVIMSDKNTGKFSVTGAVRNETGETIAALDVFLQKSPFDTSSLNPREWLFPTTLFLLLTGILFSIFFGRRIAQPVQVLTRTAGNVASGDFSVHVKESGAGELRLLARTFNLMMRDLENQRRDIQERHAFISALLARMSSAIIAVDDAGHVVSVNHAFDSLFSVEGKHCLDRSISTLLSQLEFRELEQAFDQFRPEQGDFREVIRYFKKGRIIHLHLVIAALEMADNQTGTLIVLDDITDTVHSSKLQAYTDLARRIAHEVKNPLTPIQLSIEHLRQAWEDGAPEFPDVFNQCMTMILDEVHSLERISSEFSRFARFPKPVFKTEDVRVLIEEIVAMYRSPANQIHIRMELPEYPLMCRCDRDQLKRAFKNLVQNAMQAIDAADGILTIRAFRTDNWITVEIEDTGHGMDNETLVHLFEPYFSTKKEGTGLGLVITRAVIDAHGGDIRVSSKPGQGACFVIRLAAVPESGNSFEGDADVEENAVDH